MPRIPSFSLVLDNYVFVVADDDNDLDDNDDDMSNNNEHSWTLSTLS